MGVLNFELCNMWNIFVIWCRGSCWLRRHRVHIVNDYADMDKTTQTLYENFEGFWQILKEQSDKKSYLGA